MPVDPWEEQAKQFKGAQPQGAAPTGTSTASDDWKIWQPGAGDQQEPSLFQRGLGMAGDVLTGVGKGALHTMSQGDEWARQHLPAFMTNQNFGFGPPANLEHVKQMATPANTAQKIGYGGEQIGEFMIPGGAEERLVGMAPKVVRPLTRIATSALSSGLVNKAQGGDFGTGAAMGAGGAALGQGVKAVAPMVAESALGIPKAARAFGKTPGKAILEETRGIRPETVAASAQERMGQLTPELEQAADAASQRPNPVRGLLPPPAQEIPLAQTGARNPRMRPMAFNAEVNPEEAMEPRSGNPMAPISEYPGINPHYLSGGAHPEMSGRVPTIQGVLIRPGEVTPGQLPSMVPNRVASLGPARRVLESSMDQAERENAGGLNSQLGTMRDFLGRRFSTNEQIPENVTPRELLDLKRGLSTEHLRWNPEMHDRALSAGRRAYGALDAELDRTVPQAADLNQRISSLIPVAQRAESISRNAPTVQRALGRFGAHTGALAGAGIGGGLGYKEGGIPGAIAGGLTGVVAPELIASPEGQMAVARSFNKARALRPLAGALLQFNRKEEK